jgi:hypothetical protein
VSDEPRPFRLEDDDEALRSRPARPPAPAAQNGEPVVQGGPELPGPRGAGGPRGGAAGGGEVREVDPRTVAERRGEAIRPAAGRSPPPPGWPGEALGFPFRRPGVGLLAGGAAFLLALDALTWVNLFLGALLKICVLPFYMRWHLRVASATAAGQDRPTTWLSAVDMQPEHFATLRGLLLRAVWLLGPGAVAWALGETGLGIALLVLGSVWFSVAMLGAAVGDPALVRPWYAVAWISAKPLPLLVAASAWWAAGLVEWTVASAASDPKVPFGSTLALSAFLRLGFLWVWLVAARVLGVLGRGWSPWSPDPAGGDEGDLPAGGE